MLKRFRTERKLSQGDLGQMLGVSQVTVSRFEGGHPPSPALAEKIRAILKRTNSESLFSAITSDTEQSHGSRLRALEPKIETKTYRTKFSYTTAQISLSGGSGDFVTVDPIGQDHLMLLLLDAVGAGPEASKFSFAVEFGYRSILSTLNQELISPEIVEKILSQAVLGTGAAWPGPPSILTATLDPSGRVQLLNSGNPSVIHFRKEGVEVLDHKPVRSALPISQTARPLSPPLFVDLAAGDAILMATDGFRDLIEKSNTSIRSKFHQSAKLFRGDSDAIMRSLTKEIQVDLDRFDDATAIILSRKRQP